MTVTGKELLQKIGDMFATLAETMREKLDGHNSRFAAMEMRLAELESRKGVEYRGVYRDEDAPYGANVMVTRSGSLWITKRATHSAPPGEDWALISKNNTTR